MLDGAGSSATVPVPVHLGGALTVAKKLFCARKNDGKKGNEKGNEKDNEKGIEKGNEKGNGKGIGKGNEKGNEEGNEKAWRNGEVTWRSTRNKQKSQKAGAVK